MFWRCLVAYIKRDLNECCFIELWVPVILLGSLLYIIRLPPICKTLAFNTWNMTSIRTSLKRKNKLN